MGIQYIVVYHVLVWIEASVFSVARGRIRYALGTYVDPGALVSTGMPAAGMPFGNGQQIDKLFKSEADNVSLIAQKSILQDIVHRRAACLRGSR